MSLKRKIAPGGLLSAWDWKCRFQRLGMTRRQAWKHAFSQDLKAAFVSSRVEHLPPKLRSRPMVVVDVGANDGIWLASLSEFCCIEHAEAFEPNPESFGRLRARFHRKANICLYQAAVGEKPGTLMLKIMASNDFSSFLPVSRLVEKQYGREAARVTQEVPVEVTTLDTALRSLESIDLLKVDVQGFERSVFSGAYQTLKRTRAVLVEANLKSHYLGDDTFGSLYELLTKEHGLVLLGYVPSVSRSGWMCPVDRCHLSKRDGAIGRRGKMRAAYVTLYDAQDVESWSGLGLNIARSLEQQGIDFDYIRYPCSGTAACLASSGSCGAGTSRASDIYRSENQNWQGILPGRCKLS